MAINLPAYINYSKFLAFKRFIHLLHNLGVLNAQDAAEMLRFLNNNALKVRFLLK